MIRKGSSVSSEAIGSITNLPKAPADDVLSVGIADKISTTWAGIISQARDTPFRSMVQRGSFMLMLVVQGTLHITVEDTDYTVPTGQFVVVRPGERCGGHEPNLAGLVVHYVHFTISPYRRNAGLESFALPRLATASSLGRTSELFRLVIEGFHSKHGLTARTVGDGLSDPESRLTLLSLLSTLRTLNVAMPEAVGSAKVALAERGRAFIRAHFDEAITAVDVAKALDCSSEYLRKSFNATYGYGPTEFLLQMRFYRARQLLVNTREPIAQIASECGFHSFSYFIRAFRLHHGVTPNQYRIAHSPGYTIPSY